MLTCKTRGAPTRLAIADDKVAAQQPAKMSGDQADTNAIT